MRILFLDDERNPSTVSWLTYPKNAEFTVVRTARELLDAVDGLETFDIWSLDHDLGLDEAGELAPTGYDALVLALYRLGHKAPQHVWVHSKNPIGAQNMAIYWNNWRKHNQCNTPT